MAYKHIKVPSDGEKIKVNKDFSLTVPDNPIIPYIEGDGTGVDITPVDAQGRRRRRGEGLRRQAARSSGWRCTPARSPARCTAKTSGCPRKRWKPRKEYVVSIKGPLTTPVGGGIRSHQRRAAPGTRPVRLPAPGALVHGRAHRRSRSRKTRHGDLPRERRGHLRRHRVAGRVGRGEEADQVPDQGNEGQEDPLPATRRQSASSRSRSEGTERLIRARLSSTRSTTSASR